MSATSKFKLRGYLKSLAKRDDNGFMSTFSGIRKSLAFEKFGQLIEVVEEIKPSALKKYSSAGRKSFADLMWDAPLSSLTLIGEFSFAAEWIRINKIKINEFRRVQVGIQDYVILGEFDKAISALRQYRADKGWSMWATELEFALIQEVNGGDELRKFYVSLAKQSDGKIASLLAHVFFDRNDETLSSDAFVSKCESSIPRINIPYDLKVHVFYKALARVRSVKEDLPLILAKEFTSSLVDYYEAVVDSLFTSIGEGDSELKAAAVDCCRQLLAAGVIDSRLKKILAISGAGDQVILKDLMCAPGGRSSKVIDGMLTGEVPLEEGSPFEGQNICRVFVDGIKAKDSAVFLVKFGVNFKGLDVGVAAGTFAAHLTSDVFVDEVVNRWINVLGDGVRFESLLCGRSNDVRPNLEIISRYDDDHRLSGQAKKAISILDGDEVDFDGELDGHLLVWLARELSLEGRSKDAIRIAEFISGRGGYWSRSADKIFILAGAAGGNFEFALGVVVGVLLDDPERGSELPLAYLFKNKKWVDIRHIDCVEIGLATHYAYQITSDDRIRYLCRMACREFQRQGIKEKVFSQWSSTSELRKRKLIAFLGVVWNGDNLSMTDIKSTQEERQERIATLQLLMEIDEEPKSLAEYSVEIKNLTFDETLWDGLKDINELRVFVNEVAISRWADKELTHDFERWLRIKSEEKISGGSALQEYLAGPESNMFLEFLPKEGLSESDALVAGIIERLLYRFLMDKADGLKFYLSSRIRHGTLKGTLFGGLESQGFLISGRADESNFASRWIGQEFTADESVWIVSRFKAFTASLVKIVNDLLGERVHIRAHDHPKGMIFINLSQEHVRALLEQVGGIKSLQFLVSLSFALFWEHLKGSLIQLSAHIRIQVRQEIYEAFELLVEDMRSLGAKTTQILLALRASATQAQSQCDIAADWFLPEKDLEKREYSLEEAVEIARRATRNVYQGFLAKIVLEVECEEPLPLTNYALAVIVDCLYIIFENAWKHSGLGSALGDIKVFARFDASNSVLCLRVASLLSDDVRNTLKDERIMAMRSKYLDDVPLDLAALEGGSGFAKLACFSMRVSRDAYSNPLMFGVSADGEWEVSLCIPLNIRGGAYEAIG